MIAAGGGRSNRTVRRDRKRHTFMNVKNSGLGEEIEGGRAYVGAYEFGV